MSIFNRLPVGYQEVEYIESNGTQYINTGITSITKEFAIEMNFSITTSQEYQALWCCRTHNVDVTRTCFTTGLTGFRNDQGNQITASNALNLEQKYNLKSTKTQFILDGNVLLNNITTTNNAINDKLWLLSAYTVGTSNPSNQFKGKLYSCKIWDNSELIRHYIPCYRKSDNVIGLYDLVNDVFYINAGTGVFTKGSNVDSVKAITFSKLPTTYQEVEYLESSGTQYIDTGVVPDINTQVDYKIRFKENTITNGVLIGTRLGTEYSNRFFPIAKSSKKVFRTVLGDTQNTASINLDIDYEGSFQPQNEVSIINGTTYSLANNHFEKSTDNNLYLFGTSGYDSEHYLTTNRMYYCKIYQNNILVRNLAPCYRKSDYKPGLYDIVNNVFYTNQGTGDFEAGTEVKEVKQIEDTDGNIWWKKPSSHENLFDPTTAVIMESYFQTGQSVITASSANRMSYIQCKPNTTYEISKLQSKIFWVGYTTQLPANGVAVSGITQGTQDTFDGTTRTSLDFTTGSNATYLVFRYTQIYMDGSANADTIKNSIEIYEK